jgi:hypothetical protein
VVGVPTHLPGQQEHEDKGSDREAYVGEQRELRAVAEGSGRRVRTRQEPQAAEEHGADDGDADGGAESLRGAKDAGSGAGFRARHRGKHKVLVRLKPPKNTTANTAPAENGACRNSTGFSSGSWPRLSARSSQQTSSSNATAQPPKQIQVQIGQPYCSPSISGTRRSSNPPVSRIRLAGSKPRLV